MTVDVAPIGRALISVSDKTGLETLAGALSQRGIEIVSTGGTASALAKAGVAVVDVAQLTEFPEMMDGRLKTLHPRVHGGLLAIRAEPAHQAAMIANAIRPIDLLVVNLYPFEAALKRGRGVRRHDREHRHRRSRDDPRGGQEPQRRRRHRRRRRLRRAARGDGRQRRRRDAEIPPRHGAEGLCAHGRLRCGDLQLARRARSARRSRPGAAFGGKLASALRYGENPHQSAAFYV